MICSLQMLIDMPLDEARRVAERVATRFSAVACGTDVAVGPYHKVHGWQTATVRFRCAEGRTTFDELLAIVSAGWELTGPRIAVWNSQLLLGGQPRAPFVEQAVKWALMEQELPSGRAATD